MTLTPMKTPPGPPPANGLPSMLKFINAMNKDLLGTMNTYQQTYGDVYLIQAGEMKQMVFIHPDAMREVLVTQAAVFDKDIFYTDARTGLARFLGNGLLTSNGDFWKRQRKLVAPSMHVKRITTYAQQMVDYTLAMLDTWRDGARLDVNLEMSALTMRIVASTLFNSDISTYINRVNAAMKVIQDFTSEWSLLPPWLPTPGEMRARRAVRDLDEVIYSMIRQWKETGEDRGDLLSMLLLARDEDDQPMSDKQARDETVTLFLAGHETTANALSWTWMLLAQNPAVEARLHEELDTVLNGRVPTLADLEHLPYTEMVVKESMRLYPPAWGVSRVATADTEIAGYSVPKGMVISLPWYITQRDSRWFDDPERFDPERFSPENEAKIERYAYLPFGGGPRVCIGNSFAMMEARLLLAAIAQRYSLSLAPGQKVEMLPRITLNPKNGLPMTLHKRRPVITTPQPERTLEPAL